MHTSFILCDSEHFSDRGGGRLRGALPHFFSYISLLWHQFCTGVLCNCHPPGYASFGAKKEK